MLKFDRSDQYQWLHVAVCRLCEDEDHVDIDTYMDGDSQSLRESLQWEAASNASSPTDSTSTNNSE